METIKMNEAAGGRLFELCRRDIYWDIGDFVEETGMPIERLNDYFGGRRDLEEEDLAKFARACRMEKDAMAECLVSAIAEEEEKLRQEKALQETIDKGREEDALRREKEALYNARRAEIMADLAEYGVDHIYDGGNYQVEDYYRLKFVMRFLRCEGGLPKLEALLKICTDEDLVYKDTNALMWASGSKLSYQILLLLKNRKGFISRHIGQKDGMGRVALHYYAGNSGADPDGIDLLVEWGADVNAKDDRLWSPLHCAESRQDDELAGRLIKLGAVSSKDSEGYTPEAIRDQLDAIDAW